MVRGERIKHMKLPGFTVSAAVVGPFYTEQINGELLRMRIDGPQVGSFTLGESGINSSFGTFVTASGAASYDAYFASGVSVDKISVATLGLTSGTANTFGDITIFYR